MGEMHLFLIWQIFILSFDALRERKARSALTISMVVAGCDLIVALNGMCACQVAFTSKKAIKYLGIAWHGMAWHGMWATPTVLWRSS
jgi:hypothetical protein